MLCKYCNQERGTAAVCPHCGARNLLNPQPQHLPNGTVIGGKYRLEGVLGEGGFGITYLGKEILLGRYVAVKEYFPRGFSYRNVTVNTEVSISEEDEDSQFQRGMERFLREAQIVAKFSKESGIVDVRDFVEQNNTAYIIMEYLEGVTLKEYLKEHGIMTASETFNMLMPIINVLEQIHAAGVIHRDISPENIMMLPDGSLKLMDFGAARNLESNNYTTSIVLKKGFAPEEQYRVNGEQGPWTDVYALCATIYRCITGTTPPEALDRLVNDTMKRPSELGADISPELENTLMYGMAVRKDDRCQDMTEFKRLTGYAMQYPNSRPADTDTPAPMKPSDSAPVGAVEPKNVRQSTAPSYPTPSVTDESVSSQEQTFSPMSESDEPTFRYSVSLKIWVLTLLAGTILLLFAGPQYPNALTTSSLWTIALVFLLAYLVVSAFYVFRTHHNSQAKNVFLAGIVFCSILFLGLLLMFPIGFLF